MCKCCTQLCILFLHPFVFTNAHMSSLRPRLHAACTCEPCNLVNPSVIVNALASLCANDAGKRAGTRPKKKLWRTPKPNDKLENRQNIYIRKKLRNTHLMSSWNGLNLAPIVLHRGHVGARPRLCSLTSTSTHSWHSPQMHSEHA